MADRMALVIGVGKAGALPVLNGARSDAARFHAWARTPLSKGGGGYKSVLIDDSQGPVAFDRIKKAAEKILEEYPERFVLYFSGHGISNQTGDYWLLSNWDRDSDEAINVAGSRRNLLRLPIGQVAIFSDACRSSLNRAAFVGGRVLFPVAAQRAPTPAKVDEFFATDVGDIAQELKDGEDPAKSYGVFSRVLLSALAGEAPEAIETEADGRFVTSQSLADWLDRTVPLESGKIAGGVVQYPYTNSGWREPGNRHAGPIPEPRPALTGGPKAMGGLEALTVGDAETADAVTGEVPAEKPKKPRKPRVSARLKARLEEAGARRHLAAAEAEARLSQLHGRNHFETGQGLTVIGAAVTKAVSGPHRRCDLFQENGLFHVRGADGPQSVALRLDDGRWAATVILPGFIATLSVGQSGVESLNYAPPGAGLGALSGPFVVRWNALLGLGRRASGADLIAFGHEVRQEKQINPALGVLAAYAFEQANDLQDILSVADFFRYGNGFIPFDVAALAYDVKPQDAAGAFPLMTRGWALLDSVEWADPRLAALRPGLTGAVWTTLAAKEGETLAGLIEQGEL